MTGIRGYLLATMLLDSRLRTRERGRHYAFYVTSAFELYMLALFTPQKCHRNVIKNS